MSMPSTYDTGAAAASSSEPFNRSYIVTLDSILKITQAVRKKNVHKHGSAVFVSRQQRDSDIRGFFVIISGIFG